MSAHPSTAAPQEVACTLVKFAQANGVLAIHGLQEAILNAASMLHRFGTQSESGGNALADTWCKEAEFQKREVARKQAKIDRLMIEYCPEEMTPEQIEEWRKHQVKTSPEQEAQLQRALSTPSAARFASFEEWLEFYSPGARQAFTEGEIIPLRNAWAAATENASSELVERVQQFDAAIRRIAGHVGAVCGGVDTGPRGGHTADAIIEAIDRRTCTASAQSEKRV